MNNPTHKRHRDFTLAYFGKIMGEATCLQGGAVSWWMNDDYILTLNEDGTVETIDNWGDESDKMYAIYGYCKFQNIPISGLDT